jgi:hypothetical protein
MSVKFSTAVGWVYAHRRKDGAIKIGWSSNVRQRVAALGGGRRSLLGMRVGTMADEKALHTRLAAHLIPGTLNHEHYRADPEVLAEVASWPAHDLPAHGWATGAKRRP